jgi:hypothetical protein
MMLGSPPDPPVGRAKARIVAERRHVGHAGRGDSGQSPQARQDRVHGFDVARRILSRVRQEELGREDVLGIVAALRREELAEAPGEEAGTDEQDDGQRGLGHQEAAAQPLAGTARHPVIALVQGVPRSDVQAAPCRHQAGQHSGVDRDDAGEGQNAAVEPDLFEPWQGVRRQCGERFGDAPRKEQAECPAAQRQHQALGEELSGQPAPARAERGTDGQLALPGDAPGQEQVGDVGAGDEQDEADGHREHEEGRTDARRRRLGERPHVHLDRFPLAEQQVRRHGARHRAGRRRSLGLGLERRHAGPQAPQGREDLDAALLRVLRRIDDIREPQSRAGDR